MTRYSHTDWKDLYQRRQRAMIRVALTRDCHPQLWKNAATLLLEAHYYGPWKMIWNLFTGEVSRTWSWYVLRRWEWRKRVGRQSEEFAEADRMLEEEREIQQIVAQL